MKITGNTQTVLAIGGAVLVLGYLLRSQAAKVVERVGEFNEGTPFEGFGVVGTLGNVTNQASGGILADAGSAIGLFFSNIFDRRTLEDFDTMNPNNPEFIGPPA